jgi:hypothetical protein
MSIEKISCRKHYDVVKGSAEETEQTEESVYVVYAILE